MAEESDLEKTEPASYKRLEQAREDGDVPRSRELATCTILLATGGALWVLGDDMLRALSRMLSQSLTLTREQAFDMNLLLVAFIERCENIMLAFAPLAGLLLLVALASPLLIGGWIFSSKGFMPSASKMNPVAGLTRMISKTALMELIKAVLKSLLVGLVAWYVIRGKFDALMGLAMEPLYSGSAHLGQMLLSSFIVLVSALVLIAVIDAPYQVWQYAQKLMMTKQDVRQEYKESEGNPEIKAKIRAQQREMARRRMMSEIPKADVVVTNPTHYAVALKYAEGGFGAPRVVAKGSDVLAAKIRELAAEHHVPLLEAPPLARALYRHTELGDEIPQALYTAVAEVLAYVYQLRAYKKHGGQAPLLPAELPVPSELDPAAAKGAGA